MEWREGGREVRREGDGGREGGMEGGGGGGGGGGGRRMFFAWYMYVYAGSRCSCKQCLLESPFSPP